MAALKMDTGRLLVVHDPLCLYSGLSTTYTLVGGIDPGPDWLVARSLLHSRGLLGPDRSQLSLREKE